MPGPENRCRCNSTIREAGWPSAISGRCSLVHDREADNGALTADSERFSALSIVHAIGSTEGNKIMASPATGAVAKSLLMNRTPTRRRFVGFRGLAATLAMGLCVWQGGGFDSAKAAGLTPDGDIIGLRTTMTPDQIKQVIRQQFGTTDFAPKTLKFGISEYSRDVGFGFSGDITSAQDKAANQTRMDAQRKAALAMGCNSPLCMPLANGLIKDTIDVYVDPTEGSSGVLALMRQTEYPQDTKMLETVFFQSLTEKYGRQTWDDNFTNYYWTDGAMNQNQVMECGRFADNIGDLQRQFPQVMNGFANSPMTAYGKSKAKPPLCSMYLHVNIGWTTGAMGTSDYNTKYIQKFTMSLVNVRASYNALSAYAAEFW